MLARHDNQLKSTFFSKWSYSSRVVTRNEEDYRCDAEGVNRAVGNGTVAITTQSAHHCRAQNVAMFASDRGNSYDVIYFSGVFQPEHKSEPEQSEHPN
jgi:hypothetical protein